MKFKYQTPSPVIQRGRFLFLRVGWRSWACQSSGGAGNSGFQIRLKATKTQANNRLAGDFLLFFIHRVTDQRHLLFSDKMSEIVTNKIVFF